MASLFEWVIGNRRYRGPSENDIPKVSPKIFVFAMDQKEAANWLSSDSALKFTRKIPLSGLSRGYGDIYCTADSAVCLLIVGTGLINAALTVSRLTSSDEFDLSETYFLLTGIGGVNPRIATLGAVAFAKFAIQVDTQLEFDGREVPSTWISGYVPMGADSPDSFPGYLHGSEIYELNDKLRQVAISLARAATLDDSQAAAEERAQYSGAPNDMYHAATLKPSVLEGDVLSSNVFWHGYRISEGMANVAKVYTSGKAEYVMTAQEDSAILTALLRAALQKQVDFSRIILIRSGSNFDRAPSQDQSPKLPYKLNGGGLQPALRNLYLTGIKIVDGILKGWSTKFKEGLEADNYIGDVFGTLGGTPDFLKGKSPTSA
ncbi:purine nucleoside permease [Nemania sp. FL0031]|nr:purine nucleoside permease [Nemania sp. FL0031]